MRCFEKSRSSSRSLTFTGTIFKDFLFEPAYVKGKKISLLALGRERPIDDLERVFSVPMQREYFPVQLADMGADFEFLLPERDIYFFPHSIISAKKHEHPGSAYSYRFVRGKDPL